MSILKQKLDQAAQQFQNHNFKEALSLYQDCLAFCKRTDQSKSMVHNIMTTKGALLCILGQFQRSLNILNEVLRSDPNHYLGLMRRSQVYKKKGKFNRALKDLQSISNVSPDNLQLTAMKLQIQKLKAKNKHVNSSQQSQEEEDEFDEEAELNFSNLKKIDRKSCSIMTPIKKNGRNSRVTISGDVLIQYESNYDPDRTANSTPNSKQAKQKFIATIKQIQSIQQTKQPTPTIIAKPNNRSKSILKNTAKNISIISAVSEPVHDNPRDSCLIDKLKNIEGKFIAASTFSQGGEKKQVQFRKSMFAPVPTQILHSSQNQPKPKAGRKSCMRPSTFVPLQVQPEVKQKNTGPRASKFDNLSRKSIDGAVIKNRKSFQKDEIKENIDQSQGSENGSTHNIFGNQQLVLSKQISNKLGLDKQQAKTKAKGRAGGGKSILKKNSVLAPQPFKIEQIQPKKSITPVKQAKKAKKSVMFHGNNFDE